MKIKRNFFVGDEWLYFKIYCGEKVADNLLSNEIKTITDNLIKSKITKKWFFIRYADNDNHLRLRFFVPKTENIVKIINILRQKLKPHTESGTIWKIVIDTYNRELERYGKNSIELVENLFYCNSKLIISDLQYLSEEKDRFLYGLLIADELLNNFQYNISDKYNIINEFRTNFATEFSANKTTINQLKDKYRNFSKDIRITLNKENQSFSHLHDKIYEYSKKINTYVEKIISLSKNKKLDVNIKDLIGSLLHMQINRLFIYNQRVYEFVLYDFLTQYYKSEIAKSERK